MRQYAPDQHVFVSGSYHLQIYVDTNDHGGHRVAPYFIPDPEKPYEGLATTTTADATPMQDWLPTLNWIYIDAHSQQLRYGVREDADSNFAGPFDCSTQHQHLTFQKWEGFCAVEVQPETWAIYFDINDNGMKGMVSPGARILEIELERKESENVAAASRQIVVTETEEQESEGCFERNSTFSSCSEVDQDPTVHTSSSVICTRLERKERIVKEEVSDPRFRSVHLLIAFALRSSYLLYLSQRSTAIVYQSKHAY
ncbi:uncharacterized protein N0V89_012069 [Didymosphaeria variabile]|uniref:Uncharacterized protein n=1 Tax=Didymosphaeria variabile TaxID=1932322 RepID=A0A9W9C6Z1_9PLEO|nr:uncharacterized protein N0V89_012069 [Didymosphaeria variabile]KAJ4345933.1 hypothetical protein N0V89_012069 [Didymosphaeria variabile]